MPNEKIIWGKLGVNIPKYIIESDASIVAPLLFARVLAGKGETFALTLRGLPNRSGTIWQSKLGKHRPANRFLVTFDPADHRRLRASTELRVHSATV